MATTLTEKMRAALRISSQAEAITNEINDCIEACKRDLQQVGVNNLDESDALIVRAITIYCKAEFGYSEKAQQFRASYDSLKLALSLMEEYQTAPEQTDQEEEQDGSSTEEMEQEGAVDNG